MVPIPTAVPIPPPTPTPLLRGGEWSDSFPYFNAKPSVFTNTARSYDGVVLAIVDSNAWIQTWDMHFAAGEFFQTRALSDSIQLAQIPGGERYYTFGVYTSTVFDAARPVDWTSASYTYFFTGAVHSTIEFRSGDVAPPDSTWSAWSGGYSPNYNYACWASAITQIGTCPSSLYGIPNSRYFQYRLTLLTNDTTITPAVYDVQISYGIYTSNGTVTSPSIAPADLSTWHQVFYSGTVPLNTSLGVDVLAPNGVVLLSNLNSGDSLAAIDPRVYPVIKLRGRLSTTDLGYSPELDEWGVRWVPNPSIHLPLIPHVK